MSRRLDMRGSSICRASPGADMNVEMHAKDVAKYPPSACSGFGNAMDVPFLEPPALMV